MLTKNAIGNLINRYRAVLTKCHYLNMFGTLAVAGAVVLSGGALQLIFSFISCPAPVKFFQCIFF